MKGISVADGQRPPLQTTPQNLKLTQKPDAVLLLPVRLFFQLHGNTEDASGVGGGNLAVQIHVAGAVGNGALRVGLQLYGAAQRQPRVGGGDLSVAIHVAQPDRLFGFIEYRLLFS